MEAVRNLKNSIQEKKCVKIIAGIDNYDIENILKVVHAADKGGADAVDIAARKDIIRVVKENTDIPIFVSSIEPEELLMAKENGADVLEIGNFDALYKKGLRITAEEVLKTVQKTVELIGDNVMLCVTIPGHIEIAEQIRLAQILEGMEVDLIQTEGSSTMEAQSAGARGLMEKALVSISNTIELCKNIDIPVMTASGITSMTAPMALAAGASAVGIGSSVNKLNSELEMIITVKTIVEAVKTEKASSEKVFI